MTNNATSSIKTSTEMTSINFLNQRLEKTTKTIAEEIRPPINDNQALGTLLKYKIIKSNAPKENPRKALEAVIKNLFNLRCDFLTTFLLDIKSSTETLKKSAIIFKVVISGRTSAFSHLEMAFEL